MTEIIISGAGVGMIPGQDVTGPGIPPGSRIVSVDGNTAAVRSGFPVPRNRHERRRARALGRAGR